MGGGGDSLEKGWQERRRHDVIHRVSVLCRKQPRQAPDAGWGVGACERPVGRWRAVGATGSWMPVPGSLDPLLPPRSCAAVSAEAARGHRAGALGAGLATRRWGRRRQGSRAPAIKGVLGAD